MNFKEYVQLREAGVISKLRSNHAESPFISHIAADQATESDEDMDDYIAYVNKIAKKYQKSLDAWKDKPDGWMTGALANLDKFFTVLKTLSSDNMQELTTKQLTKMLDNANADWGNSETPDKRVEQIIHWGLIVVDRLHSFFNDKPWYSKDEPYTPSRTPASARIPF